MAYEPVQTPGSDDVELDDILRHHSDHDVIPTVVIRKDSSAAASASGTQVDDNDSRSTDRLPTPAPMATFEVLSDVEESDMDEVSSISESRSGQVNKLTGDRGADDVPGDASWLTCANGSVDATTLQPDGHVTSPPLHAEADGNGEVASPTGADENVLPPAGDEILPTVYVLEDTVNDTAVSPPQQTADSAWTTDHHQRMYSPTDTLHPANHRNHGPWTEEVGGGQEGLPPLMLYLLCVCVLLPDCHATKKEMKCQWSHRVVMADFL